MATRTVKVGGVFPTFEVRSSQDVRDYAQGVEHAGLDHVLLYDHVVGADPAVRPGWSKYTNKDPFHEPLVMFGFLAAACRLGLVSGVMVLPQRQTVLVAKQVAQADWLSEGRVRLGVGLGWNEVEYEALGVPFENRGARLEEQIALMRRLFCEESVTFHGRFHTVNAAGLAPLPVQRPVPLWIGARIGGKALRRVGQLADGWFPLGPIGQPAEDALAEVRGAASQAGRDPAAVGVEPRVNLADGDWSRVTDEVAFWLENGATHVSFSTMGAGLRRMEDHVSMLGRAADLLAR